MEKEFRIKINTQEEDFCDVDLREVITDGIENVGNHTLNNVEIEQLN